MPEGDVTGALSTVRFAENGYLLATATADDNVVRVWDLRNGNQTQSFEAKGPITALAWDWSAQNLAAGSAKSITVWNYARPSKSWSSLTEFDIGAKSLAWGSDASSLVVLNSKGDIVVCK